MDYTTIREEVKRLRENGVSCAEIRDVVIKEFESEQVQSEINTIAERYGLNEDSRLDRKKLAELLLWWAYTGPKKDNLDPKDLKDVKEYIHWFLQFRI